MLDYQRQMVTIDNLLANQSQAEEQMQFQNQNFDANEQSVSIFVPEPNLTATEKQLAVTLAEETASMPESIPTATNTRFNSNTTDMLEMILDQTDIKTECISDENFNIGTGANLKNVKFHSQLKMEMKCERSVFICSEEQSYMNNKDFMQYLLTIKTFHQNIDKSSNNDLPRKKVMNHWDALDSIVCVKNRSNEDAFNEQKIKFSREGKVDKYGKVPEYFLFHGTANENINMIIEDNFVINHNPSDRSKAMLFGRGIYLSELPGVSLMYGEGLLMCKVILGKCQKYFPNGGTPPPIPEGYDSRIVIKNGMEVVCVVKDPSQILPYSIVNIKPDRIIQTGTWTIGSQEQEQPAQGNNNNIILARG